MSLTEINFDGIVGPSHNYAGLSLGNIASASHKGDPSYPRAAALQGLAKMRGNLARLGVQGFLLPLPRPNALLANVLAMDGTEVPQLRAAPWSASNTFRDAKDAANALVDVTLETVPDARLMTRVDREEGTFLGFSTPGKLGEDVVEFWIKNEAVSDRDWEGDQGNGPLVLYRSFAVDVKYVYPFMTPVGDFGAQSQRLRSIREALGWQILGCELIECFQ